MLNNSKRMILALKINRRYKNNNIKEDQNI